MVRGVFSRSLVLVVSLVVLLAGQGQLASARIDQPFEIKSIYRDDDHRAECKIGVNGSSISSIAPGGPIPQREVFFGAAVDTRPHAPGDTLILLIVIENSTEWDCGAGEQLSDVHAEILIDETLTPLTLVFPTGNPPGVLEPGENAYAVLLHTVPNNIGQSVHIKVKAHAEDSTNTNPDGFDTADTDTSSVLIGPPGAGMAVHHARPFRGTVTCLPRPQRTSFCDDFDQRTQYKDETLAAQWWRYTFDRDEAASYVSRAVSYINRDAENHLRLEVSDYATSTHYTNADISTSEINNFEGDFLFGENTRVEVRMRYSPNMRANGYDTGTAQGSAGLLFWNYFTEPVDPELKNLNRVRDAFGFVWQDQNAVPTPGFWLASVVQGIPAIYTPYYHIDLSEFHTYALERRPDSMKFFIDDQLIQIVPLNQPSGWSLPAESKLSVDMWVDNTTYVLDFTTFQIDLIFNDLTETQFIEIDYVLVTKL